MKRLVLIGSLACLLPMASEAALYDYSVTAAATQRNCVVTDIPCAPGPLLNQIINGLPGDLIASASVEGPGHARAYASNASFTPALVADARAGRDFRFNGTAIALQSYTYLGDTPTTRSFEGLLTYAQNVPPSVDGDWERGVIATLMAFRLPSALIDFGDTAESNFAVLFNPFALTGFELIASNYFADTSTKPSFTTPTIFGIDFLLNPGDTVWIHASLATPAPSLASIGAGTSLTTRWNDATDIERGAREQTVPEPAGLALLAVGMLSALRRRLSQQ